MSSPFFSHLFFHLSSRLSLLSASSSLFVSIDDNDNDHSFSQLSVRTALTCRSLSLSLFFMVMYFHGRNKRKDTLLQCVLVQKIVMKASLGPCNVHIRFTFLWKSPGLALRLHGVSP